MAGRNALTRDWQHEDYAGRVSDYDRRMAARLNEMNTNLAKDPTRYGIPTTDRDMEGWDWGAWRRSPWNPSNDEGLAHNPNPRRDLLGRAVPD